MESINSIVNIEITDENGTPIIKPFRLKNGENIFKCIATYIDGSREYYKAYWTCPIFNPKGSDYYSLLGHNAKDFVVLDASFEFNKYSDLSCWVLPPDNPEVGDNIYPHDSTSFDYSEFNI